MESYAAIEQIDSLIVTVFCRGMIVWFHSVIQCWHSLIAFYTYQPTLNLWNILWHSLIFIYQWILFAKILFRNVISIFVKEIGLWFSYLIIFSCLVLRISVILTSLNELQNSPSFYTSGRICVSLVLSWPIILFLKIFLIMDCISLAVKRLFKFFITWLID